MSSELREDRKSIFTPTITHADLQPLLKLSMQTNKLVSKMSEQNTSSIRPTSAPNDGSTTEPEHLKGLALQPATPSGAQISTSKTPPYYFVHGANPSPAPLNLQTLPYDLQYPLVKHLDPTTSTCLGLTCRDFYAVHWRVCGTVPFEPITSVLQPPVNNLATLLRDWMLSRWGLVFSIHIGRFVDPERWFELEDIHWGDGWEST